MPDRNGDFRRLHRQDAYDVSAGLPVGTLQFNAPNYTFDVGAGSTGQDLTINGVGISASPANAPTFNVIGTPSSFNPLDGFHGQQLGWHGEQSLLAIHVDHK